MMKDSDFINKKFNLGLDSKHYLRPKWRTQNTARQNLMESQPTVLPIIEPRSKQYSPERRSIQDSPVPLRFQLPPSYTFWVDKGNNHPLVKKILLKRSWLYESRQNPHVVWRPQIKEFNYRAMSQLQKFRKVCINHLENHREFTNKENLYNNLKLYCQRTKQVLDQIVPQTFIIDMRNPAQIKEFVDVFQKQTIGQSNTNLWILKPPDLNRGQGIQIFDSITQLNSIIGCLKQKKHGYRPHSNIQRYHGLIEKSFFKEEGQKSIVIQKYIENPLLYEGKKFDFRVWVLVDHKLSYYFFREGYIRLASQEYQLNTTDKFVHLTNNAIQKFHGDYGKSEKGNQISFGQLMSYLRQKNVKCTLNQITSKMKELVQTSFFSCHEFLKQCDKQFQYEIFGFDFMMDSNLNVWLIEINTNPCLEESSPLLEKLIPRMLNDAFRLTIDKIYLKPEYIMEDSKIFNYSEQENLWDHLGNIYD